MHTCKSFTTCNFFTRIFGIIFSIKIFECINAGDCIYCCIVKISRRVWYAKGTKLHIAIIILDILHVLKILNCKHNSIFISLRMHLRSYVTWLSMHIMHINWLSTIFRTWSIIFQGRIWGEGRGGGRSPRTLLGNNYAEAYSELWP